MGAEDERIVIGLDFDGLLHDYAGWDGPVPTGGIVPGAKEFVHWLIQRNYKPVIFSSRANHPMGKSAIEAWLVQWGFPPLDVSLQKPEAKLYVDDRGFRFEGDFRPVIDFLIKNPEPGRWGDRNGD